MEESNSKIYKNYISVAWPAALEGLLIMLISSVDLAMVGSLGSIATSAVGITQQPRILVLCFSRSLCVAVTAIAARRFGQNNLSAVNICLKQALIVEFVISAVLVILPECFLYDILRIVGAQSEYIDLAAEYGKYIFAGLFFTTMTSVINAVQIAVGDTKTVLVCNATANGVNLLFDYLLIFGIGFFPKLGVMGAGIATFIGNVFSFIIAIYSVSGKKRPTKILFILSKDGWKPNKKAMLEFRGIGISALGEKLAERFGMILFSTIIANLGTAAFATYFICNNMADIFYNFCQGLSKASAAFTGQKLGEKSPQMAVRYGKAGRNIGFVLSLFVCAAFIIFKKQFMEIFTSDPDVIALGCKILIITAFCSIPQTFALIYSGVLRGAGDTKYVTMYSLLDIAILRPVLTWFLCWKLNMGVYGAWFAMITDQTIRMLASGLRFRNGKWKEIEI